MISQIRILSSVVLVVRLSTFHVNGQLPCIDLKDNTYIVKFLVKGVDEYKLSLSNDSFVKTLKDETIVKGKIHRLGCLIVMLDSETNKGTFDDEIEKGLGVPALQLTRVEGSTIYFKTVRSGNINIVLDEGVMQLAKSITGRVIDSFDFQPMPEANLMLGSSVLAISDKEGNFSAQLPQNADTLLVTFIGMEPMYIKLSDTCTRVEVIMIPDGTYDYMSIRKINRKRKRYFDELPAKHKIAFERGVFTSASPCLSYLFQKHR